MKAFILLAVTLFLSTLVAPVTAETVIQSEVQVLKAAQAEYPRTVLRPASTLIKTQNPMLRFL
jgi:hypothetical protein